MQRQLPAWTQTANVLLSQMYPKVTFDFLPHTSDEIMNAECPHCGKGTDRFVIFSDGNTWCRKCGAKGFWRSSLTNEEKKAHTREKELNEQATLRMLSSCKDWKAYHKNAFSHLTDWEVHGIDQTDVDKWMLGWDDQHFHIPTLTIPIFYKGVLRNIRHRVIGATDSEQKYRSHFKNTPTAAKSKFTMTP